MCPRTFWMVMSHNCEQVFIIERLSQKCQPLRVPAVNRGASEGLCQHAKGVGGVVLPPFFMWEGV